MSNDKTLSCGFWKPVLAILVDVDGHVIVAVYRHVARLVKTQQDHFCRTPGSKEHETVMQDLRQHADYLDQLAKVRGPVLWRPRHEIEGGWFWWSDTKTPEKTAKLWRMMFDNHEGH